MRPFIYTWPAGTLLTYMRAVKYCETEEAPAAPAPAPPPAPAPDLELYLRNLAVVKTPIPAAGSALQAGIDFGRFIKSLREAGFRNVHFLSHSMGTRLFFNCFTHIQPHLQPRGAAAADSAEAPLLQCQSIVALNGEAPVEPFVQVCTGSCG